MKPRGKKRFGERIAVAVAGISAAKEARDFYMQLVELLACNLEDAFRKDVADFEKCEKNGSWRDWIEGQAWLAWSYKGCPEEQGDQATLDDYMHAQRYLAFLVADHVLSSIRKGRCPLEVLTEVPRYGI